MQLEFCRGAVKVNILESDTGEEPTLSDAESSPDSQ